jgi:predicted peroxiredoxin
MTASAPSRPLVVKITAGANDPERANQGFTVAAAAVSAGAQVSVWLTGEAVWMAVPGHAEEFELPHAAPLDALVALLLLSGRITVCTQCAARRDLTESDLLPGVVISGAASYVDEVLAEGVQALVY